MNKKRYLSVVVEFSEGQKMQGVAFDSPLIGGKVISLAAYDQSECLDIAEEALHVLEHEEAACDALERIKRVICTGRAR